MQKLEKQDIKDIAYGCIATYVQNSFKKDELIRELANICVELMEEIDGINTDLSEEEDE